MDGLIENAQIAHDSASSVLSFLSSVTVLHWLIITGLIICATFKSSLFALFRLGRGLSKKHIAIIADPETSTSLKQYISDSKLFSEKRINTIHLDSLSRLEQAHIILAHWSYIRDNLDAVLSAKRDSTFLIIYAPSNGDRIPPNSMDQISNVRNSTVTNFRGRLMNDIIVSTIAVSYEKKK